MADLKFAAEVMRAQFYEGQAPGVDAASRRLESPLESAFYWTLCGWSQAAHAGPTSASPLPGAVEESAIAVLAKMGTARVWVFPQLEVITGDAGYRLDLAVHAVDRVLGTTAFVAVELDGHEFHDRTREQAERDRKRDRDLQALGWRVARFTGSQVARDPLEAVRELESFILSALARRPAPAAVEG